MALVLATSGLGCSGGNTRHSLRGEARYPHVSFAYTPTAAPGNNTKPSTSAAKPPVAKAKPGRPEVVAAGFQAERPSGDSRPVDPNLSDELAEPRPLADEGKSAGEKPSAPGMTLDEVINATLLADPRLRVGFELIAQARGDYVTSTLRPNPAFNIDQTLLPLGKPFTEDAQGGPPQLDVGLAFPIDWFLFGKRAAAMLATRLGVNATEAEFANLIRERVLDAATAYYDVLEAKALLEVAEQDAANYRRVEGITEKAVDGGGRPRVEFSRIRLDRLQSEQRVREAELALVQAKAALRAVMGRSDADPDFDVAGTLDDIPQIEPLPTEEAFAVALENRPDLEALRLRIAEANAQILVERRDAFPEVLPRAGYTRQFQQKAIGFPDVSSFGFGLEMTLPIFNRNQGNRLKALAVAAQQSYELQAGIVDVRAEVVSVEQELKTASANAKAVADEQLKLAIEVRETLNKAYSLGGRPLIDVLDAQRNYRETYRIFIESRANYGRAVARYNATLGKRIAP